MGADWQDRERLVAGKCVWLSFLESSMESKISKSDKKEKEVSIEGVLYNKNEMLKSFRKGSLSLKLSVLCAGLSLRFHHLKILIDLTSCVCVHTHECATVFRWR